MRCLAGILAGIVVALPLTTAPSGVTGAFALVAGAMLTASILALSPLLVTVGIALSLIEYTLALTLPSKAPEPVTAAALGIALMLLLEVVDFARRFRGAVLSPSVVRDQIRRWAWAGIITAGGTGVVCLVAAGVAIALPPVASPFLGVVGALGAAIGVIRAALRQLEDENSANA